MGILDRLEQRALSGHPRDPVIADWFQQSAMSAAGFAVTPDSAMRVSAVFACVRILAQSIAGLPVRVFKRLANGGKEADDSHSISPLLRRRPNGWQTSFEWRAMSVAHQGLRGVAYSKIMLTRQGNASLVPLHPDAVRAEQRSDGSIIYEYTPRTGKREVLLQDEVLRVPFLVLDGVTPLSPIGAQREAIGSALAAQDYASRFFKNDAVPRAYIKLAGHFKDAEAKKKFRESWQEVYAGAGRHSMAVLEDGMELKDLGMSNRDAQFVEARKLQIADIARIYGIPLHMLSELDRATFSNIEQQSIEFVVHTIAPWLVRWEQALSMYLLPESQQDTHFVEFNVAGLLRGDIAARYRAFAVGRQWGWLSANDVRRMENQNPIDGGDTYLSPANMTPADQIAQALEEKAA